MKTKLFTLCLASCFLCLVSVAQQPSAKFRKLPGISDYFLITRNPPAASFYISGKPVTNREYITYLCWLNNVYTDYPEVFIEALPAVDEGKPKRNFIGGMNIGREFKALVLSEPGISRDYVFNPEYIDYPVAGISWNQAMKFLDWLYHRYNEYSLIRKGELKYDPDQRNANNFNTEAYLALQYEGLVGKLIPDKESNSVRRSRWSDPNTFYPAFRLPSRNELTLSHNNLNTVFKPYKLPDFLQFWSKSFIEIKNDTLILTLDRRRPTKTIIVSTGMNQKFPSAPQEFYLDQEIGKKLTEIPDIYKELGQEVINIDLNTLPAKNDLGFVQFTIIGEDDNSNPVCVKRIKYERNIPAGEFTIFRFAMNAKK